MSLEGIALLKVSIEYKRDEIVMTSSYMQDPTTVPTTKATPSEYYVNWLFYHCNVLVISYHCISTRTLPWNINVISHWTHW